MRSQLNKTKASVELGAILQWANAIVRSASGEGLTVRLFGSVGIAYNCLEHFTQALLNQRHWKDLDFVCPSKHYDGVRHVIEKFGFRRLAEVELATDGERAMFASHDQSFLVDLAFDNLVFCHRIPLGDRLTCNRMTLSPADLLLSKLQRVEMRDVDFQDIALLVASFDFMTDGDTGIDLGRLSAVLGSDWGFWYTALGNLRQLKARLSSFEQLFAPPMITDRIRSAVDSLIALLMSMPKMWKWRLRAAIGPRMKWYTSVGNAEVF
jgi:hypothetical protein